MKQIKLWMLATILTSCGLMMLSSCSNEDNTDTPPTDEVEAQLRGKDGAHSVSIMRQNARWLQFFSY